MAEAERQLEEKNIIEENEVSENEEALTEEKLLTTQEDIRLVEAILFAAVTPIDKAIIAERFPEDRAELIPEILEHLQKEYEGRGINLVKRANKWAFRTDTDLSDKMKLEKDQCRKFTKAAMETMAIIAYHQPVTRAEIENIRGVATSSGSLDALMEAGWVKPGKRRDVPGRPMTWISTKDFLDHFGIENLTDLPGMEELKEAGLLDKRLAIDAIPGAKDLFDEDINKGKELEDPQEVTDEDLLGSTENDEVESLPSDDIEVNETTDTIEENIEENIENKEI